MKYENLTSDTYYHIYNRGNNFEDIFFENRNYSYFLNKVDKYLTKVCIVYAYCLLKNHFHLVVKTKNDVEDKTISLQFSHLFNSYAQAINKAYSRKGKLFSLPFKRKKIENEKYLKSVVIYTHLNPEHHKFVIDYRTYEHSSYQSYLSNLPSRLGREFILELFDGLENFKYIHLIKRNKLNLDNDYSLE